MFITFHTLNSMKESNVNMCNDAMFMLRVFLSTTCAMCMLQAVSSQKFFISFGDISGKQETNLFYF